MAERLLSKDVPFRKERTGFTFPAPDVIIKPGIVGSTLTIKDPTLPTDKGLIVNGSGDVPFLREEIKGYYPPRSGNLF